MSINPPRYSKHFICVRMLLSMHSVIIDLCDIHIHISTCCYLTIPTSSVPRAVRFNWHLLYLLPLHVFSLHVSHGQIRRTLIAHLSIRWLNLRVELTFLSSQVCRHKQRMQRAECNSLVVPTLSVACILPVSIRYSTVDNGG